MARILVTDDSNFLRRRTCTMLQEAGHDTIEATDGKACLAAIDKQIPDALFLDLVMPEMDGFAVLRALKASNHHFPVIVLTADIQESVKSECIDLGAAAFVNKPPKADEVNAALNTALANAKVG